MLPQVQVQTALPFQPLAADVAHEVLLHRVLDHVLLQRVLVRAPLVTVGTVHNFPFTLFRDESMINLILSGVRLKLISPRLLLLYLFMLPQVFVDFKRLITVLHITVVPLLFIMDHLMDPQGTTCGESFLAFVTLIGFLSCMNSLVIFQSSLHSECLSTCFTFERFLMSMVPSDVNVEVELFLKDFITALMWTFPIGTNVLRVHVPDTVLVQLCRRLKLLGTFLT